MKIIQGIAGSPGIAGGKLLIYGKTRPKGEKTDFNKALETALEKVKKSEKKALNDFGEENAKIFSAYKMILEDTTLTEPIKQAVSNGTPPESAVKEVTESFASVLSSKNNEYMRQRADDIRYIGKLLIDIINGAESDFSFPEGNEKYILIARELTPVDTMAFDKDRLLGIITELGGATSHTVILAKSIGIPAVVGAEGVTMCIQGKNAYIDGYNGDFVYDPDEATCKIWEQKLCDEHNLQESLETMKSSDTYTKNGERIAVCINIGNPLDLDAVDFKFDGVGLFRSEFLYSSSSTKPKTDEQINAYRSVLDRVSPNSVTIRTLDIGGDKQLDYISSKDEENPFLGNRGIRLCLSNPEIFSEQLKSILLAATGKHVNIMLPMITSADEIIKTREIIDNICRELDKNNTQRCTDFSLGIMIETPASAVMSDVLAKYCDFFSVGTNDLVQYMTAADRGNSDVSDVYNPYHPSIIRILNHIIKSANGIEVSLCGDLAANTDFTKLLLGMGLKKFSVPIPMVGRIKHIISSVDLNDAKSFAEKVLKCENEHEIKKLLKEAAV